MARRAREEAEKTRARILASALASFVKKGYEHTTFTDIAARLRMTKGAVYWHFASKEALLVALVEEMLAKFQRLADLSNMEDLTFRKVAGLMVAEAQQLVGETKGTAFFLLMHEQIQWSRASMASVRQSLMKNERFGPWHAFRRAVINDVAAGRVRADADPEQVAHTCCAIWDGLVHAHIAKFMACDLGETMTRAFDGVWRAIGV